MADYVANMQQGYAHHHVEIDLPPRSTGYSSQHGFLESLLHRYSPLILSVIALILLTFSIGIDSWSEGSGDIGNNSCDFTFGLNNVEYTILGKTKKLRYDSFVQYCGGSLINETMYPFNYSCDDARHLRDTALSTNILISMAFCFCCFSTLSYIISVKRVIKPIIKESFSILSVVFVACSWLVWILDGQPTVKHLVEDTLQETEVSLLFFSSLGPAIISSLLFLLTTLLPRFFETLTETESIASI
eukprot:TRINITY_DN14729_c0_g1_i1.p1 TRINITY_DN14729_c0_g1~~TRINITY_DN14729_c0_g1_i1.p1  ORF type:complete len:245 (+),score=38.22 TRINITY_DN14729_c0_g1_i1:86-820(+)